MILCIDKHQFVKLHCFQLLATMPIQLYTSVNKSLINCPRIAPTGNRLRKQLPFISNKTSFLFFPIPIHAHAYINGCPHQTSAQVKRIGLNAKLSPTQPQPFHCLHASSRVVGFESCVSLKNSIIWIFVIVFFPFIILYLSEQSWYCATCQMCKLMFCSVFWDVSTTIFSMCAPWA